jgi:hypothetical protein
MIGINIKLIRIDLELERHKNCMIAVAELQTVFIDVSHVVPCWCKIPYNLKYIHAATPRPYFPNIDLT